MSAFALAAYGLVAWMLNPALPLFLRWRARRGKEDPARLGERLGRASLPRPEGMLVWLHGVSVGESGVARMLALVLAERQPGLNFLVTSATRTSAAQWSEFCACDPLFRHQFVPLDSPQCVRKFLDHWQPDLGIFIESEIWPNLLRASARRGIRLALVNARMNARSRRFWRSVPGAARAIFGGFSFIGAADSETAEMLGKFVISPPILTGNLKAAGSATGRNQAWHDRLAADWQGRFVWIGISTHDGEEEILLAAHRRLRARHGNSILILAPRHPERADRVAEIVTHAGFTASRWSGILAGASQPGGNDILLADRLGDMGLWLGLAQAAFIGGSLHPDYKGHNPMEAAAVGVPILAGPHVSSFAPLYTQLREAEAMILAETDEAIAMALVRLAGDPAFARTLADAAQKMRAQAAAGLDVTIAALLALLERK